MTLLGSGMKRGRLVVVAVLVGLLGVPAVALGIATRFQGKIGKKATLSIQVKVSNGKITQIKQFVWDGLKCGNDVFTGGNSKPIKVQNDKFSSSQPTSVSKKLTLHVSGSFSANHTKAKGTLKITGGCKSGQQSWSAKAGG